MDTAAALPFDIAGPLPTGVTVLEASAGTGKTYAIASLAARYVAEGTPLERLLLVTFTRMATGELRERVRERLIAVEAGMTRALAGGSSPARDAVVDLLIEGGDDEVRPRRERLRRALSDFDGATIVTTHAFCQEVLGGLGIAGDLESDARFVEDVEDLLEEVVDDLYVRRFHREDGTPDFRRPEAGEIGRTAVANPTEPIVPATGTVPEMRRRLALAVRDEVELRKRRLAVVTYDDLLTRLDAALSGTNGEAVAARLRARFGVVLIDEFQDTDLVQWGIIRRAFGEGDTTLVLIGDPKQAIYAFRGADVYAYLKAAREAAARASLDVNWRSDQGLIDAYDAMFGGARLGHEGIVYRQVRATAANQASRLSGAPVAAPLRIRVLHRADVTVTNKGFASNGAAREHIARDVAAEIVALLSSGAEIEARADDGTAVGRERVRPGHVAVLVPTNRNAALVRTALEDAGVPAVINGAGSVFGTPAGREWLRLLEAIERPASPARARAATLTCFFGWTAEQLAGADDEAWEAVHRRLHHWARVLRVTGVAAMTETITAVEGLPARVLQATDGERRLTDLRHIGQLLHAAATAEQLGPTALAGWLRERVAEAERDTGDEERSRRLESDAEAVQVLTVHRSKGLEFPVVHLPFLWEPGFVPKGNPPIVFHDPSDDDRRAIDVSLAGSEYQAHKQQSVEERRGEDLRLAYVALTRAKHQAVVWWAGSFDSRSSPLGRLLFARKPDGTIAPAGTTTPTDAAASERFRELAAEAPGCISVERSALGMPASWAGPLAATADLTAARFDRDLDWGWRRTSYSDITAGTYEARVSSEPEETVVEDEPAEPGPPVAADDARRGTPADAVPSLLADLPAGVHVGTLVHRVLEATDFDAPDLDAALQAQVAAAQARRRVEVGDPAALVAGLRAFIETPLAWGCVLQVQDGLARPDLQAKYGQSANRASESLALVDKQFRGFVASVQAGPFAEKFASAVRRWADGHPIEGALYRRPSIDSAVAQLLASSGANGVFAALGNLDETMADVMTRMDLYTMYLPRLARWEAELAADDLTRGVDAQALSAEFEQFTKAVDRIATVAETAPDVMARERAAVLDAVRGERLRLLDAVREERVVFLEAVKKERIATLHEVELIAQRLTDRSGPALHGAVRANMEEFVKSVEEMRKRLMVDSGEALDRVVDHAFFRLVELLLVCAGLVALGFMLRGLLLRRRERQRGVP